MQVTGLFGRRVVIFSAAAVLVFLAGGLFAFEPVTRNLLASEDVCTYCHADAEYAPSTRLSFSKPHPLAPMENEVPAECADCHLPEGFLGAAFMYTHIASATDLFGHFRDRDSERAADWIPQSAARAFRMRDRLYEYDSVTCRTCHIEAEMKPKRKRGQRAHAKALKNKETCIECHDNMVHRYVDVRKSAFQKPKAGVK